MNLNAFTILKSIPGIGPVWATGILSEIGEITAFHSSDALANYGEFYDKKYAEVTKHQHKRALALTSRKFVRLVFGLLVKSQLYTGEKLDAEIYTETE